MVGPRRGRRCELEDPNTDENVISKPPRKKPKPEDDFSKQCKEARKVCQKTVKTEQSSSTSKPLKKIPSTAVLTPKENCSDKQIEKTTRGSEMYIHSLGSGISSGVKTCYSCELDAFQTELIGSGLKKRTEEPKLSGFIPTVERSQNILHMFQNLSMGMKSKCYLKQSFRHPVINLTKELELFRTASPFDRRVTALEWHPVKPNILGVGSKGGDIILLDTENVNNDKFVQGIGAAGSCQALKFWPWDTDKVVSASINGTVTLHDFETQEGLTLADTMDSYDHWYCSVDVCSSRYMVAAGRNHGILHVMSTEGRKIFECKLHKQKVTHVEFSPREDWLLCTASTDQTVKMWDVRYLKDKKSSLYELRHEKPVNSAYFSCTDGCRLLTTDQNREIRVYRAPDWHLETTIQHPHRFFQHITPFKATWHPLQDLVVCGRYPDATFPGSGKELRTIDIFDAESGEILSQVYNPGTDGLCPLNKFNHQGDVLASGMGFHILVWNRKQFIERKQSLLMDSLKSALGVNNLGSRGERSVPGPSASNSRSNSRSSGLPRSKKKKTDDDTDDLKKKKTVKTSQKTAAKTETKSKSKNK